MLVRFFFALRLAGIPVTLTEFLSLLEGLRANVVSPSAQDVYFLARAGLVKYERYDDRVDRVFAASFEGAEQLFASLAAELPADWLRALAQRTLTEEEKAQIEALGGWDKLLEA